MKKILMSFYDSKNKITTPIDPGEGHRYIEPVKDERELDNIYNITSNRFDYVDPNVDGKLSWENTISWDGDSEQALEEWRNRRHEVSTRRCAYMTKSLRWIGSEVFNVPSFDGTNDLEEFICAYQVTVQEKDWLRALDVALKATAARWWVTHKDHIEDWSQLKSLMTTHFSTTMVYEGVKYKGDTLPRDYMDVCLEAWKTVPQVEWVHRFTSTLDTIPKNWYVKLELRRGTEVWGEMMKKFIYTFRFEVESPKVDNTL